MYVSTKDMLLHDMHSPLTILDAKTGGPLFKGHLLVLVGITLLEEAGGTVLHWHKRDPEWGQL